MRISCARGRSCSPAPRRTMRARLPPACVGVARSRVEGDGLPSQGDRRFAEAAAGRSLPVRVPSPRLASPSPKPLWSPLGRLFSMSTPRHFAPRWRAGGHPAVLRPSELKVEDRICLRDHGVDRAPTGGAPLLASKGTREPSPRRSPLGSFGQGSSSPSWWARDLEA